MAWRKGLASVVALLALPGLLHAQVEEKKLAFDVASVRENISGEPGYSNYPLNSGPQFDAKGGLLLAKDMVLLQYIVFAYKPDMFQIREFRSKLPEWARTSHFDIEARADGSPTKDDMRLMMQSLLAERFHMAVHSEMREEIVYAVQLVRPGALGPHLKPHPADDPTCAKVTLPPTVAGAYPSACGAAASVSPETPGDFAVAGYAIAMDNIAASIGGAANITDRRVVDQTGLSGTFDLHFEFAPEVKLSAQPDADWDSMPGGPTLAEALKRQLGLKLVAQKRTFEVIVIDRLERPTEN